MKHFILIVLAVLVFAMAPVAQSQSRFAKDPFKGKWKVTVTPDDDSKKNGGKSFEDELIFNGSVFTSTEMAKKGFKAAVYEQDTRGIQTAKFNVTVLSEKEGKNDWQGAAVVDQLEGTLVWTKTDDTKITFSFKGERTSEKP